MRQCWVGSEINGSRAHSTSSNTCTLKVVHMHQSEFPNMPWVRVSEFAVHVSNGSLCLKKKKISPISHSITKKVIGKMSPVQLLKENQPQLVSVEPSK